MAFLFSFPLFSSGTVPDLFQIPKGGILLVLWLLLLFFFNGKFPQEKYSCFARETENAFASLKFAALE